ncbi:ABC transporter ATP-binding protein [Candidatus Nomurabacteria bacterium]|uniref:ABC transporter ATP-binding protein n=1 Tax=Candidatus Dojkabacteria bacterium TaxID=2099670 RepID=A0A955KYG0_9BACT|nr:ABC transporter ATP-binding protein [Candidatus Dojkabacteria bacterium]MCB9803921.1 ABC transporter ATP-binding protein [Candidatus Nomurabacteria bacterium]
MEKKAQEKRMSVKKLRKFISNSIWVYKQMFRISRLDSSILILSSLINSAVPTIQAFFSAKLLDEIIQIVDQGLTEIRSLQDIRNIFTTISLMALSYFLQNLTRRIRRYYDDKFRRLHFREFELEMVRNISKLDVQQFEDPRISDSIQKAKDNFYKIQVLTQSSIEFTSQLVSTIITGTISFTISPLLFIFVTILSIPNNIIFAKFIRNIWNFYNNNIERNRRGWWLRGSLTDETELPEHKITRSDRYIYKRVKSIFREHWTEEMEILKKRVRGELFSIFLNALTLMIIPLVLLQKLLQGQFSIGDFTFYRGRFMDYSGELDYMFGIFLEIVDNSSYITYVRDLFDIRSEIKEGDKKLDLSKPMKIEFRDLSFKYPKEKKYSLKDINLTIHPSDEVAIVGENGAGKTTLIKLLLRFYEPTKGQILINDIPIDEYTITSYYKAFSAIFQDYNIYEALDVKENIGIGKPDAEFNLEEIKRASKAADAHSFIEKLDKKYGQILSKQFTDGTKLSKGQTQKIAIARNFYRNTRILILDEPTASIDAQAEHKIFDRIYQFTEDKTVIIISHRFSTVRKAQKIFVLSNGRLIESGSHEELMEIKGVYSEAFNLQAEGYQPANL